MRVITTVFSVLLVSFVAIYSVIAMDENQLANESNCIACHTLVPTGSHFIESNNDCQFCHVSSNDNNLHANQTIYGNDLCLACHVEQDVLNSNNAHETLNCVDCHNPHGSDIEFNLNNQVVNLCANSCHTTHDIGTSHPVGDNLKDDYSGGTLTCVSTCHSMHQPKEEKYLKFVNTADDICAKCHNENY